MTTTTKAPSRRAISRGVATTVRDLDRFLAQPRSANLAYSRRDGSPFVVPVWFQWRNGELRIGTGAAEPKVRAIRRNPRVSVLVHDDRPPYRVAIIEGDADIEVLDPADSDPTDGLPVGHLGRIGGKFYEQQVAESGAFDGGRAVIRIVPDVIRANDGPAGHRGRLGRTRRCATGCPGSDRGSTTRASGGVLETGWPGVTATSWCDW